MANPTVAELILRVRELARERTAVFWADSDASMLGFVTAGLEAQHAALTRRLGGAKPPGSSPYWSQFHTSKTIALAVGTSEYSLPTTEGERFAIMDELLDSTGLPFEQYSRSREQEIAKSALTLKGEPNYYCYVPGNKIRVIVATGADGVPQEVRNLTLLYWRDIKHHESASDTIDIRDEFCEAPRWYALALAYQSRQLSMAESMAAYRAALEDVA